MTGEARRTLAVIRDCLARDCYAVTVHFEERMEQRGLFWPDVQGIIAAPRHVRSDGVDEYDRPKWIIGGQTAGGGSVEIVCAIEVDESGTVFITLYWND
jgi:hypothetical protein